MQKAKLEANKFCLYCQLLPREYFLILLYRRFDFKILGIIFVGCDVAQNDLAGIYFAINLLDFQD